MKNLFTLAAALLFTIVLTAQDSTTFKKETIEFIKITGAGSAFDDAIAQIGGMVSEANKAAFIKEAQGTLEPLYEKLADLYMKEFTQSEISELVKFYNTALGKKLASKQTSLAQQGMQLGQTWGMEVGQIAQKYAN